MCCSAELPVSGLLFGNCFFRQVCVSSVMAADSAAATGGQAGITFDVELVVPWDAPEAVITFDSDGSLDLDMVPDVI